MKEKCWIFREDGFEIAYFNRCKVCKDGFFGKFHKGRVCKHCNQHLFSERIIESYPWETKEEKDIFRNNLKLLLGIEGLPFFKTKEEFMGALRSGLAGKIKEIRNSSL